MKVLLGATALAFMLGCYCWILPAPSGTADDLEAFIGVPVQERFAQARADGDNRFLGVYDYALSVPGVPDYYDEYWPWKRVLPIPGTSDFPQSHRESDLNDKAWAYALEYNALLLKRP